MVNYANVENKLIKAYCDKEERKHQESVRKLENEYNETTEELLFIESMGYAAIELANIPDEVLKTIVSKRNNRCTVIIRLLYFTFLIGTPLSVLFWCLTDHWTFTSGTVIGISLLLIMWGLIGLPMSICIGDIDDYIKEKLPATPEELALKARKGGLAKHVPMIYDSDKKG